MWDAAQKFVRICIFCPFWWIFQLHSAKWYLGKCTVFPSFTTLCPCILMFLQTSKLFVLRSKTFVLDFFFKLNKTGWNTPKLCKWTLHQAKTCQHITAVNWTWEQLKKICSSYLVQRPLSLIHIYNDQHYVTAV